MGGGGSIGLYSAMFAKAAGSSRVDYIDTDVARLAIAERFGANAVESAPPQRTKDRYPVVVDASASREGLQCALRSVEPEGIVASAGGHLEATVPLPLHEMWVRGLTLTIAPGPLGTTVAAVLDWVSAGRVRPELVTSEVANFDDAPRILAEPSSSPFWRARRSMAPAIGACPRPQRRNLLEGLHASLLAMTSFRFKSRTGTTVSAAEFAIVVDDPVPI